MASGWGPERHRPGRRAWTHRGPAVGSSPPAGPHPGPNVMQGRDLNPHSPASQVVGRDSGPSLGFLHRTAHGKAGRGVLRRYHCHRGAQGTRRPHSMLQAWLYVGLSGQAIPRRQSASRDQSKVPKRSLAPLTPAFPPRANWRARTVPRPWGLQRGPGPNCTASGTARPLPDAAPAAPGPRPGSGSRQGAGRLPFPSWRR